jgi:hypothetical protein
VSRFGGCALRMRPRGKVMAETPSRLGARRAGKIVSDFIGRSGNYMSQPQWLNNDRRMVGEKWSTGVFQHRSEEADGSSRRNGTAHVTFFASEIGLEVVDAFAG